MQSNPQPAAIPGPGDTSQRGLDLDVGSEAIRMLGFMSYANHHAMLGGVLPALESMLHINTTLGSTLLRAASGQQSWVDALTDNTRRLVAGVRFHHLVHTVGRELFGSARFPGEEVIAQDEILRLSYLPPTAPSQGVALFHAGGGLPYSDRIFRMLPEANFYQRFLERGIGVYAMELRGERSEVDASKLTLARLIDSIQSMSDKAFEHCGQHKMILEGYCGQGMQALAYAAALPQDAERKFQSIATFVAPIDGTLCGELAEFSKMAPESLLRAEMELFRVMGGYVPGESMGMGLDIPLHTLFHKTPFGHFRAGFDQPDYADRGDERDWTPAQRRDLAGTWWITYENSARFPLSVDLVAFASALFRKGISKDGAIPFSYKGRGLSLRDLAEQTTLKLFGFYGSRDTMVPDRTAQCLEALFAERYKHVVHLHAGHISYILSPKAWDAAYPKALKPNPIDVLLAHSCAR
ncbi:MAG: hypothetical protein HY898_19515 [Deltaproteobacteria bacterium]|nr:hypothetical protein [Deltaproteobacteria bacterium]